MAAHKAAGSRGRGPPVIGSSMVGRMRQFRTNKLFKQKEPWDRRREDTERKGKERERILGKREKEGKGI